MGIFKVEGRRSKVEVVLLFVFFVFSALGCSTIQEMFKCTLGISTKALEDGRKEALVKTFNYDIDTCYAKAKETLKDSGNYIYSEDKEKHVLAIYLSEADTTPVGIFFVEVDSANTRVEVSSPSTYAKEYIATKIYDAYAKMAKQETEEEQVALEEEGQADASKEETGNK